MARASTVVCTCMCVCVSILLFLSLLPRIDASPTSQSVSPVQVLPFSLSACPLLGGDKLEFFNVGAIIDGRE